MFKLCMVVAIAINTAVVLSLPSPWGIAFAVFVAACNIATLVAAIALSQRSPN